MNVWPDEDDLVGVDDEDGGVESDDDPCDRCGHKRVVHGAKDKGCRCCTQDAFREVAP